MTELFVRRPVDLDLPENAVCTRIPADQAIVSLSAILLDDAYFAALQETKRKLDGVTIVDETLLIPLMARAVLDLTDRSEAKGNRHRKDIAKHRRDVFRLAQLLPEDTRVTLRNPSAGTSKPLSTWLVPTNPSIPNPLEFRSPGMRQPIFSARCAG